MPDIVTIPIYAPFDISVPPNTRDIGATATGRFEVQVARVPERDAPRAAVLRHPGGSEKETAYLLADGRLVRRLALRPDLQPWTLRRLAEHAPILSMRDGWCSDGAWLRLLPRPFGERLSDDGHAPVPPPESPAWPVALARIGNLARDGLVVVGDVLHHVVPPPAWSIRPRRGVAFEACAPGIDDLQGLALIDIRHPAEAVASALGRRRVEKGSRPEVDLLEPDLLPATDEAASLATFCLYMTRWLDLGGLKTRFHPAFLSEVFGLMADAQSPWVTPRERRERVEWLAGMVELPDIDGGPGGVDFARAARLFLRLCRQLPAPSPVDEVEASPRP